MACARARASRSTDAMIVNSLRCYLPRTVHDHEAHLVPGPC